MANRENAERMAVRVEGSFTVGADRGTVWASLLSSEMLASCIPGCEGLQPLEDDSYEVSLTAGVGPIRATYAGRIALSDKIEPESFRMLFTGQGSAGSVRGEGTVTLVEAGDETEIRVVGDAQVTGAIARVGQRLMGSASRMLMNQFFACAKAKIEESKQ
ncbi:MAG: carbon monoxide dehydrogenase subunit G [Chloroflexi bacterium]|nr:carbon monoxide dehydrogenase subunit G [Chloroflexota bacterium]